MQKKNLVLLLIVCVVSKLFSYEELVLYTCSALEKNILFHHSKNKNNKNKTIKEMKRKINTYVFEEN
jgi:hypothetical protein